MAKKTTEAVESRGRRLILGAAGIDYLAADVADDPDIIEFDVAQCRDRRLTLGEIIEVAQVESDALPVRFGSALRCAQSGNLAIMRRR